MEYRRIPLEAANAHNIEPFGQLLSRPAEAGLASDFYRGEITMSHPVKFHCEYPVDVALATLRRRDGDVKYMERHFAHTQTFIPLGGKPFVMVLAPPSDSAEPNLMAARAFYFGGSQGFTLHLGTWHEFPFALEDGTDLIVLLSSQTGADLKTKDSSQEALGPDLDKKDVARRTGTVLTVELTPPAVA